jgi:putative addiction module component (TIGR02574 family)
MHDLEEPAGFDSLSIDEKIELVQRLWDRIAAAPDLVPVPEWHQRVVRERLAAYREHPEETLSWPEARDQIQRSLRDRKR